MSMMHASRTILLTGVNGQVGHELARSLQGLGRVVALDRQALDLADPDAIRRVMRELVPALVVNPAAYTAVDQAETDVAGATCLNVDAPAVFAEEARRAGAALVHYSTDYVYAGEGEARYAETDPTGPRNVYGRTKLEGEQAIAASGCRHLILRTSWVYGMRGRNFLRTMLRLGAERSELNVVADQIGAPTWSRTIAELTAAILAQSVSPGVSADDWWAAHSGVFHLAAGGETSWHGFAEAIFEQAGGERRPAVRPIPAASYPTPAARPSNSRLSMDKLERTFGLTVPHWREALRLCMTAAD
ncbi:dTDP-4-dehydrorhamnose reductase [Burkholderia glumae]|nr:DTDP-4-dehydrorhamnose reductase [Burkholderia glumae BGR1]PJO23779.1 dTDP-4-dehydrorhamnose reductase [Burkholderia glumae AU6208]PNL02389.1 dTDP-4-dehydrorhamnose reductase [Burkholderia glumae]QHE09904.1 dTDP-4-dehydrorhamnose reductase [Burkholderia glumae AU6208]QHP91934.1 dTDP-4-dehydrorhamnose reductase [Burkholderia glumae]